MGTKSSNTAENIAITAIELSQQTISRCFINSDQSQLLDFNFDVIGNNNKVKIEQAMSAVFDVDCKQKSKVQSEVTQNVINAIKQEAKAKGTDFSFTNTETDNYVLNLSELRSNVDMDSIVETIVSIKQKQIIKSGGSIVGDGNVISLSQGITLQAFLDATMDAIKLSSFTQAAANEIDQKGDSETKSTMVGVVNAISDMVGAIGAAWFIMIAVVVLAIVGGISWVLVSLVTGDNIDSISGAVEKNKTWGGEDFLMNFDY
jgi:hypothetical protein